MKEIGGYIELDISRGDEYHKTALALNSGRHCLEYLIRAKKIKKLYIPYFLCASVRNMCHKIDCEYELYHTDAEFKPVLDKVPEDSEYVYIVNYYGQISNKYLKECKDRYKNIIVDNAQDFFRMPIADTDTIYTCRKFFGVSDGGYLYTDKLLSDTLSDDVSYERIHYILGRFEAGAGKFYEKSANNNKQFAQEELKNMSKLTHNLMRSLDYKFISQRRRENFEYLHDRLKGINKLNLTIPNGAFMYPLYVDNGKELKKKLIQKKIFVPTLWGDVFDVCTEETVEYDFANNIVPLPVDQRYDIEDMKKIVDSIMEL